MSKETPSDMKRVTMLAELLVKAKGAVEAAEVALSEKKAAMLKLERDDLPALMEEVGMTSVKLTSGKIIEIKKGVEAKIPEAMKGKAFAWLLKHGFGGIIKTAVAVTFGKGEHEKALAVQKALAKEYEGVTLDENVHPSTLKSFVTERNEKGEPVPADLFGAFYFSRAVVKE